MVLTRLGDFDPINLSVFLFIFQKFTLYRIQLNTIVTEYIKKSISSNIFALKTKLILNE